MALCGMGVAGMIVASIVNANGVALTFGLLTVGAVACLMVATAVAGAGPGRAGPVDELQAERVEGLVAQVVATGAAEPLVRSLVREAVRLGRSGGTREVGESGEVEGVGAEVHGGRTPRPDEGGI